MSKTRYLFPYNSRFIGIALILVHIPVKLFWDAHFSGGYDHFNPSTTAADTSLFSLPHLFFIGTTLMVLVGLFLIAFSKEKIEDEQIVQLRLDSLRWAIYLNYAILLFSLIFTRGSDSKHILMLNIWLPLLFFILRFQWVMHRLNRSAKSNDSDNNP
jgi:IS4 transposase